MILSRIVLRNFRTYDHLDLTLSPKLTIICGANAAGKTNLAEAINYISLARSWRSSDDSVLLKDGSDYAAIDSYVKEGPLSREIRIEFGKNAKRILINGKPARRLSELSKLTNVLRFAPSDVPFFTGSPSERRSYLDVNLAKQSFDYFELIARYNKLLKERNLTLKSRNPDRSLLEVLTDQLIDVAEPLVRYRSMYIASLNEVMPGLLERLRGEKTTCRLVYRPFVKPDESFRVRAKKAYQGALESDLLHGSTSIGPHREDFSMELNGKDISIYGSQGENRMAVLALKLAPYFLIEDEDKKPICVLDDVTSELDENHVKCLFEVLKTIGQVFVTATNLEIQGASYIDVSANNATRRN